MVGWGGSRPFRALGFNVIDVLGRYPRLSPLAPLGLEDDGGYGEGLAGFGRGVNGEKVSREDAKGWWGEGTGWRVG